MRRSVQDILNKKKRGEKITMLTAYDYPFASLIDQADVDIILVGDSLAQVVLGLNSTQDVGMDEMLHHARAVNRAVRRAMVVGDLPFSAYQTHPQDAVKNARRFIDEAGCQAVKLEWFERCPEVTSAIVQAGIPVMGHVGLTPQTADRLGGYKVQGKDAVSAGRLIEQAQTLEARGCFSIVLECIPREIAQIISSRLSIPAIGIGAGKDCDGQVLVTHDLLGLFERFHPKFAKQYVDLGSAIKEAAGRYREEVTDGRFPDEAHSYSLPQGEMEKLRNLYSTGL